jgi:hypothetical protein
MSIPVFVVAAMLTLAAALVSDYLKRRYVVLMTGCLLAVIGYAILLSMENVPVGARYFAVYLITGGAFSAQTIGIVWLSNNMGGHYKRAIGVAMQVSKLRHYLLPSSSFLTHKRGWQVGFGNIAGIIASFIYLQSEAPTYHTGFGTGLGMLFFGILASTGFFLYLRWENAAREAGKRDWRNSLPADELDNLGDDDPRFRFIL